MRVLWLLTRDLDATGSALVREQATAHEVTTLDLRAEADYDRVVEAIAGADRVISW